MVQSMSRVHIDNAPTENFWGIVKSEMYYLNTFTDEASLRDAIAEYMNFYTTERMQSRFGGRHQQRFVLTLSQPKHPRSIPFL